MLGNTAFPLICGWIDPGVSKYSEYSSSGMSLSSMMSGLGLLSDSLLGPHATILKEKGKSLKLTEKVSFNIASEASYVYILSGPKFIKNIKNGPF